MSQQDLKPTRRKPARQRYLPASVAAAGGLVLSGIAFSAVQRFEHSRAQAEFERRVQPLVTAVQKEMSGCTAIAESVVALYEASREVERDEFAAFAQHLIAVYPFVSKLEWAPRVDEDERSGLIDYVRAQGLPAFQIAGRRPSGEPPAGEPATGEPHAQHFPICWIAPFKPDETDLGTDCAVDPDCREAIQTALADPGTAAVSATRHVNGAAEGFLRLLTPVYGYGRAPAFEKRPGELSGLVLTTVHVRALLAFALSNRDRQGIAVRLHREPPVAGPSVSGHGAGAADSNWTPAAGGATFGACERLVWCDDEDQAWTMECRSTADYVATGAVWSPWAVLVSGLFLTVLLSLHFVRAAAAGARIERLVERRTAELRVANEGLAREMDERERAAEATRRSEARYRAVTETAQDAVITTDAEGRIRLWNPAAERIFGYRAAEIVGQSMLAHIVPVRYREPMRKAFAEFVRTDQGPLLGKTVELAALRRDGSEFPIELSLSAWRGQQQDIAAAVVRDITARKRAASELLLFRSLLDQANDAIEVIDVETGRFLDINQRACISHGYTREEYLALPVCEIDPGIAQRPWPELVEELRSGTTRDRSRTYESQHRRKDGSFFPVEVSTTFVHLDRDYLLAVVRDITERKQAEEALRREHARAQQYLDIAAFMIVALNQQGEITLLNRKAHAILGYEEGTLIGRNWFTTCVPPRLRAEVHSIFERLMAGDASAAERFENAVLTRTGEERIIAWHNTVLADGSGAAVGTLSSGEDVTARRRTEAALRASEGVLAERARDHLEVNRLQQDLLGPGALGEKLTKITATAVRLLDADFCRIWVTRPGDRCQSDCVHAQVCRGPDADGQRDACLHLLASSGRYVHTEGAGHRRVPLGHYKIGRIATGEVRQLWTNTVTTDPRIHDRAWAKELGLVSFAGFQLRPPGGKTIGVLAMFSKHEVTPETNALLESLANTAAQVIQTETAEQEQRRLQSQLVQAQRLESVGQLAAGIAHEINTPTQFVSDNTRFLRDAFPKLQELLGRYQQLGDACRNGAVSATLLEELERAVKKAKLDYLLKQIPEALSDSLEGLERVTKIVRAMKDFAHPGEVSMSPADLNKAIESTVTVARNEWKYVAEVKLDLDPALPAVPCLVADFNQAVLNMIVNAAHAIKDVVGDGGRGLGAITISTRLDGDQVEVRIADNGTGIPVEHRDRIFDQFYTTKEVGRGTGQGLAIARRTIVEKHHGTLTFETEVGRGTTFIIRLPVEPDGGKAEEKLDHEFAHSARR